MKKLFIILGFVTAGLAVTLAVTPLSKIAYIPSIAGLVFGILALSTSKVNTASKTSIQLIFLMTIIALALTTYKAVFNTVEVGETKELEEKEQQLEEQSIEELEDLNLEDFEELDTKILEDIDDK